MQGNKNLRKKKKNPKNNIPFSTVCFMSSRIFLKEVRLFIKKDLTLLAIK